MTGTMIRDMQRRIGIDEKCLSKLSNVLGDKNKKAPDKEKCSELRCYTNLYSSECCTIFSQTGATEM